MTSLFQSASQFSPEVDHLAFILLIISTFFVLLVFGLIVFFSVKYRKGSSANREHPPTRNRKLEAIVVLVMLIFGFSTYSSAMKLYYQMYSPPENAHEIFGVGKQWLWIFHDLNGVDQINEMTVTLNQPTKLTLISEDVIHSLYIPAFRVKQDVLPNRYTTLWFRPTELGDFKIFCTQYCGLSHSKMMGTVHVVNAAQIQAPKFTDVVLIVPQRGKTLMAEKGCLNCHNPNIKNSIGPTLIGLYGSRVELMNGSVVQADEDYLRESIMVPSAKVVKGYGNVMPPYQGLLNNQEVHDIIAYLKQWKAKAQ